MATAASNTAKTLDASLWWDSFTHFLSELESIPLSDDLPPPLEKKLKDNHAWLLETVSLFSSPSQNSRVALDSGQVKIGSHQLNVQPELKDAALKISSILCMDEVQSCILVQRSIEKNNLAIDAMPPELPYLVMLHYYIERQCLLKCTRHILMRALYTGQSSKEGCRMWEETQTLISDGLESKLLTVLQNLLSLDFPENMDVDLCNLWAEETLSEVNLVLDIIFLVYYESFCNCTGMTWIKLCTLFEGFITDSYNFGKLAVTFETISSIYKAKVQLLLILIETLDLEILLQMIHDETPLSQGLVAFSLIEVQEMDAVISTFNALERKEAGLLILSWAVFVCLISSLPAKEDSNVLMEINHVNYVHQAFEASSLIYFLEILEGDVLKDSDGPVVGYRSVLRTFISAFIASYEISFQMEDNNLNMILDILCKTYRGEESLCTQFWDKESFVDGPIRCLLCNLEGEFPYRTVELVRFLSSLCEGAWAAECVYFFLDKSVGLSTPFEISGSITGDALQIVETRVPLTVPGVQGLVIPARSRGHVLKLIDRNIALVRWEYTQSGMLVLLLRLAQDLYSDSSEEVFVILDLLNRLVTSNEAICHALLEIGNSSTDKATLMNEHLQIYLCIDVVEILCTIIKNQPPNRSGAAIMAMGVNILAKLLKCLPSHVTKLVVKANIFDVAFRTNPFEVSYDGLSRGSWLLSGRLAKMLLIDCEQNDCQLTFAVLDFTVQLVETGLENDVTPALAIFSIQYVLVNHEFWKYNVKHARWTVTLKVLEVARKCILSFSNNKKLAEVVRDVLLGDSSIHNALLRLVCATKQDLEKLYVSRFYELADIEGLQLAMVSGLEIVSIMLSDLSKDMPSVPVFHQAVLSSMTKPIPLVTAAMSMISFFQNPSIQLAAARLLSKLFLVAGSSFSYTYGNACFGLSDFQIRSFRDSIYSILREQSPWNEDLIIATLKLLSSSALYQSPLLAALISEENQTALSQKSDRPQLPNDSGDRLMVSKGTDLLDEILHYIRKTDALINSKPNILSNVISFLKVLWEEAPQFTHILEQIKRSEKFWEHLSIPVMLVNNMQYSLSENSTDVDAESIAYRYQCQSDILGIMSYEIFLQKKILHAESLVKQTPEVSQEKAENVDSSKSRNGECLNSLKQVIATWSVTKLPEYLIKSSDFCDYDNSTNMLAKVAASVFSSHVMSKIKAGDTGSLSISLIHKIHTMFEKLSKLPAFSELLSQYAQRGYSQGKELQELVLSDLFYQLQGELEGRQIEHGPFKELSLYLQESTFLKAYQNKSGEDLLAQRKDVYLYDNSRLESDMGLNMWDYSEWKASKSVAETMLFCLRKFNSMMLLTSSKLSALKALVTFLSMCKDDSAEHKVVSTGKIPDELIASSIKHLCQNIHATTELLVPIPDASECVLDILESQAELLFLVIRSISRKLYSTDLVLILKTSGYSLKVLSSVIRSIARAKTSINLFLEMILVSFELSCKNSNSGVTDARVEPITELSTASLGLLPLLCGCIEFGNCSRFSLAAIDLIMKGFSAATWFPVIQRHLQLQHVIRKLQDLTSLSDTQSSLKFLLTLAQSREGAQMLLNAGLFASLSMLLDGLGEGWPLLAGYECSLSSANAEKPQHIWGLGLSLISAVIHSLGESSVHIIEHVMSYFLVEKASSLYYGLSAPDFSMDDHGKKRPRALRKHTSLTALQETEHTLMFLCVLARYTNSWIKVMKESDSDLRGRCIHLLAFISRGIHRHGETPRRIAPLLCHPILKDEFELYKKPSFINSRSGWFVVSSLGCASNHKSSSMGSKEQLAENTDPHQTYFSDKVAIQIYRITFLLLKFLCLQAEAAARRAEELCFVDLAHFPDLPTPEILHGLQDQGIGIVTELCEANKSKQVSSEIQGVCLLLLKTTTMALYLEYCVMLTCGIRPVSAHIEDFSKELRLLLRATDGHAFLNDSMKSLEQIVAFVYPDLRHTDVFL